MAQSSSLQVLPHLGRGVQNTQGYSACAQQRAGQAVGELAVASLCLTALMIFRCIDNLAEWFGSTVEEDLGLWTARVT